MAEQETRTEINRLYWESDESVGAIADRVGVSRRALYDSIDPKPANQRCPSCGGELGFRNRTAAERREAECLDCGLQQELTAESSTRVATPPEEERDATRPSPPRRVPQPGSGPILGGALLAGMAAGAVAGYLLRRS